MSGSNGTSPVATEEGAPPSQLDHWAYQVDTPFRAPAEIKELAGGSGSAAADEALGEGPLDSWSEAEDPFLEATELADVGLEAWEEAETEGIDGYEAEAAAASADLLEETPAGEHPLAAVFSLPRLAFDAMAKGGWATAIAVAIGAGIRDVNKLTNMVFWFRHPSLIGQKIRSDQRDLAREWVDIRNGIVKPALAGATVASSATGTPTVTPVVATPTSGGGPVPTITIDGKQAIPPDGLRWWGKGPGSPELLDFMRRVYRLHVKRSSGDFVNTLPESQVDTIEGKHRAQKDAAARAREMLAAARADLAREGLATTYRIGITSAYRSASEQFDIWQGKGGEGRRGFPNYYRESAGARRALGNEHGDAAAAHLAKYLGKYIAAPGYSNHQDGLALDLGTGLAAKGGLGKIGEKAWFHKWLVRRAHEFQFKPYKAEAWHWVYYGPRTGSQSETWEVGETWPASEAEESEAATPAIRAGRLEVANVPVLASHRGKAPDIVLRWNDMPTMPAEIDVVVHLHGYSWASMTLPKHMEVWSGLDLAPVDGASGSGRSRPTLTVLPRGHYTGEKRGRIYKYTFPALTTRDGLSKLISVSLERFAGQAGGTAPKVGRLILTAHSGGGAPLMTILRHHDPNEVHVFDGLYQDASSLAVWASRHLRADRAAVVSGSAPTGAMRVFYGRSTRTFSHKLFDALKADLQSAPASLADRYRIESSGLGHSPSPRRSGRRVLPPAAADVPEARRLPLAKASAVNRNFEFEGAGTWDDAAARAVAEAEETWKREGGPSEAVAEDLAGEVQHREGEPEFEDFEVEAPDATAAAESLDVGELDEVEEETAWDLEGDVFEGEAAGFESSEVDTNEAEASESSLSMDTVRDAEALDELEEAFPPAGTGLLPTLEHAIEPELEGSDVWKFFSRLLFIAPTVGFEFDVHYGVIPSVVAAAGLAVPADGDVITKHSESTHGFRVKLDGRRLEIATKPFTVDSAGRAELESAIAHVTAFAKQLTEGHRRSAGSTVSIPGVAGHPRPFTLTNTVVPSLPIARLWVRGVFNPSLDSVWASPQATVTVRLARVPALIQAIRKSEGSGAGVALSGSSGQRAGVRSEAAYRALGEVDRTIGGLMTARPRPTLSDGTVVDEKSFTPALRGFLVLLAMYLWTSEVSYRFDDTAPRHLRDYEPFAKAYLPMNVKAPFSEIFRTLLTPQERMVFRELFADGSARVRLFGLARPAGASLADGSRFLFPTGPKESGLDSVHERQRAEFSSIPTWNDLVDHTLDPTHLAWGERLLVPMSKQIPVSRTSPRVAIELRRIGFASVYSPQWPDFMRSVFRLVHQLDS